MVTASTIGAASLLQAVGLPELVTHSLADYEALALRLAREASFLDAIKTRLAQNLKTHPLFRPHLRTRFIKTLCITVRRTLPVERNARAVTTEA